MTELLPFITQALEASETGVLIADRRHILYANATLAKRIEVPQGLVQSGGPILALHDFCARRGDFGPSVSGQDLVDRAFSVTAEQGVLETRRETPSGRQVRARVARAGEGVVIATYNDVSELVEAQRASENLARELEERVALRTRQLAVEKARAEAAYRVKSQFLANMSHELRTPLNAIMGYSEMIGEDIEAGHYASCSEALSKIVTAGKSLLGMIDDVLDASELESGLLQMDFQIVDVRQLAMRAVEAIGPFAAQRGGDCMRLDGADALYVRADPERLFQCLMKLLSNAVRFGRGNHVTVAIEREDGSVLLRVTDNGAGMSDETLRNLFTPFMQADTGATRAHDGAGLGLFIARELMRAMGGEIQVESQLGAGSCFSLRLAEAAPA